MCVSVCGSMSVLYMYVCVWHRIVLRNSACHVMLLQPPFKRHMMSTHTPTHFLSTDPGFSSLTSAIPSFLFLSSSISESLPLCKSLFCQLFFPFIHSVKTPQVDRCDAICIHTWENVTLDRRLMEHVQNKVGHSWIYIISQHHLCGYMWLYNVIKHAELLVCLPWRCYTK